MFKPSSEGWRSYTPIDLDALVGTVASAPV